MVSQMVTSIFRLHVFEVKKGRIKGANGPSIFWPLTKGTRTFDFQSNESPSDLLELLIRFYHP